MKRVILMGLLLAGLGTAEAADDQGIPVTVQVLDAEGQPIPTAVVRHPEEADRHRVNTETGTTDIAILYLPDGTERIISKGMELEFEISAPGFQNARITYNVRKRRNLVPVILQKMDLDALMEDDEADPVIQFGRDKPID
jgi:hypothetical protein